MCGSLKGGEDLVLVPRGGMVVGLYGEYNVRQRPQKLVGTCDSLAGSVTCHVSKRVNVDRCKQISAWIRNKTAL